MFVGYARVSTLEQNLDLQIYKLKAAGCEKIYSEKVSGTKADRPEYMKMKQFIRSGHDTVIVYKLDRLGRSLSNLIIEMKYFEEHKIEFKSLQENIDTTTSGGKLFFHIFASIAEFEKDLIKERTLAGLSAARERGRVGGRPNKISEYQMKIIKSLYADKTNKIADICKEFKISRSTLYNIIQT